MAINFLNNVDYNQNQLFHARIENQASDALAGTPVDGQLYYNTGASPGLKVGEGGSWEYVGTTDTNNYVTGGGVSSGTVTLTRQGLSSVTFAINNSNITNGANYITAASLPTVNNGTLTMSTTAGIDGSATFTANQSGNSAFQVSLNLAELADMTQTMLNTDQFIVLDGSVQKRKQASEIGNAIFSNTANYITAASLPTVNNATITLVAGDVLDGGGAFTLNQSTGESITFDLATGGAGAATYGSTSNSTKIDTITLDAYGRVAAVATGSTGQVNTINSGNTSTLTSTGTTTVTLTPVTAAVANNGASLATGDQIYDFVTAQIATIPSGLSFEGNWNADTDSPDLSGATPDSGQFWIVSVAGSTDLDGITDWKVGDWAIYVSTGAGADGWQKVDNTSTLSGSGAATQLTYWTGAANVAGDAGLTYDASGNNLTVGNNITAGGIMTASGGNSTEWNTGYDNMVTGFTDSGSSTITLTLTQQDGGTLTTSFANPQGVVESIGTNTANTISIGGTAADRKVSTITATIANGGGALATADQIHTFVTTQTDTMAASTTGNAATATALQTPRAFTTSGDVVLTSANFNGTANFSTQATIQNNVVGADELDVSGDGSAGQVLASDGDGTFSWANAGANTQLATAAALIDVSAMGSNTTASFTHSLASKNLIVQIYDVTTGELVYADVDHTSINAISVIFGTTPPNDIRVVVIDAKNGLSDKTVSYT